MDILFTDFEYPPVGGGGGGANKILVDELSKKHKIHVLTSGFQNIPKFKRSKNIIIERVPSLLRRSLVTSTLVSLFFYPVLSIPKGLKILKKKKFDIIHSFFAVPSGITGLVLSKIAGIPHVLTIIGGDIHDPTKKLSPSKNFLTRLVVKFVIKNSDVVTSISHDVAKRAYRFYGSKKEIGKIEVIPIGFKEPKFRVGKKAKKSKKFIVVTLGRIVKRKGLRYLIGALKILEKESVKLIVIGRGPELVNLINLSKKLEISEKVDFVGYRDEIYDLLSKSDTFCLPSLHEGFGLVFLEAMYAGLPVIAANVGGQMDFLENGKTGFIVPVKNPRAIADAIMKLRKNKDLRNKISSFNKKRVKNFYISKVAKDYEKIYKSF